jgi:hypothetical protein
MRAKLIPILIGCLLPVQLAAQATLPLSAGARVRIWTSEMRKVVGRVDAVTSDSLMFHPDGKSDAIAVPVAAVLRLDVSRGSLSRKNSAWKRAKWSGAIGAAAGAISLGLQHEQVGEGASPAEGAALGAWSGALFGGLIGALVGAARPAENWERIR